MKQIYVLLITIFLTPCGTWAQSGNMANGLTWKYEGTTLTVSKTGEGSGVMNTFGSVPWYSYMRTIEKVIISEGVTSIGYGAFSNCSSITDLTLPESLVKIDNSAFYRCSGLTNLVLPKSLKEIEYEAFSYCYNIKGEIFIPASVTLIGNKAFESCMNIMSFSVSNDNKNYKSIDGAIISQNGKYLVAFPAGKKGTYSIPEGIESISSDAFLNCIGLTGKLTIPEGVTSIGKNAFTYCENLTGISLPSTLTTIDLPAFNNCNSLTTIDVNSNNKHFKSIDGVLYTKDGSSIIRYPTNKTGKYSIAEGVETVREYAFYGCDNLSALKLPSTLTTINNYAFYFCRNISGISFPSALMTIGENAFKGCSGLTNELIIPENVTDIGYEAFEGTKITTLTLKKTNPITLGSSAFFYNVPLKVIYVPIVSVELYKNSEWAAFYYIIQADLSTSTENLPDPSILVFPNPTSGYVTVTGLSIGEVINVYTVSGTQIIKHTATSEKVILDLSGLSKGVYLLQTEQKSIKLIKN